jgi:hypothetical protein
MSFGDARLDAALDRHITGNWGEDQFRGQEEWESFVENTCSNCLCEKWCPVVEKFYDGDDDLYDHPCLILKDKIEENERIENEMSIKMEENCCKMADEYFAEEINSDDMIDDKIEMAIWHDKLND